MALITHDIPDAKLPFFIDCFGYDYDQKVQENIDAGTIIHPDVDGKTKALYAKDRALIHLANHVRAWTRQQAANAIQGEDILT